MNTREWQTANLISFSSGIDEYGKPLQEEVYRKEIEMIMTIYTENNVSDIRFIEATHLGLTAENGITEKNHIIIDNIEYKVLYVVPSRRYNQVFLKKVL